MPDGINRVFLRGIIKSQLEVRFTQKGMAVAKLILECHCGYYDKEGKWVPRIDKIPITFFGRKNAELLNRYSEGDLIHVDGRLSGREIKGYLNSEVIGETLMPVCIEERGEPTQNSKQEEAEEDSDLPF